MNKKTIRTYLLTSIAFSMAACSATEQKEIEQEKGITELVDTATSYVVQEAITSEPTKEDFNGTYLNSRKESLVISNYKENEGFDYSYKSGKNASSCSGITLEGKMKFTSRTKATDETTAESEYSRSIEFMKSKLFFTPAMDDDIYIGMDCLQEFDSEFARNQ